MKKIAYCIPFWLSFSFLQAQIWPNIDLNADVLIVSDANSIQTENSVFISPLNKNIVLNSNNSHGWNPNLTKQTGGLGVSDFASVNGASVWAGNITGGGGLNSLADPSVVIDNNGWFYISYLNSSLGVDFSCSKDNGTTWTNYTIASKPGSNPAQYLDKCHMWVDNGSASIYEGNLYCAWTVFDQFSNPQHKQIVLSRSTNKGGTWQYPSSGAIVSAGPGMTLLSTTFHTGVNIQTGPNGEVYACWAIYDNGPLAAETALGFAASFDGGDNWSAAKRIQVIANGEYGQALSGNKTMKINGFPSMTVNKQTGEIFIVWSEFASGNGDAEIFMVKSSDNGGTWSSTIRVNQDLVGNGTDQWLPWIACDEVSGALIVIYYDARNSSNTAVETFVSISYDQGISWQDFVLSDGNTWSGQTVPGFGIKNSYAGDYIGIDVYHGRVVPVWSDARDGHMAAYTHPFDLPCPNNLSLCNAVIAGSVSMPGAGIYGVNNIITAGGTNCNYLIKNTGNVKMQAGTEIQLKNGFSVQGEYQATIFPCSAFSQRMITQSSKDTSQIANILQNKTGGFGIAVFPNPSQGLFELKSEMKTKMNSFIVYDMKGAVVLRGGEDEKKIDLRNYENGLFLVVVKTNNGVETRKIMKQE
jgi:hypothetical protein